MKLSFNNMAAAVLIGALTFSSCAKKLEDAYQNPNANVRQPVEQIFPSLIGSITGSSSAAGSAYGLCGDGLLIGRYIQFWGTYNTGTAANGTSQYDKMGGTTDASDNLGSLWAAHYYGMGQNLNRIVTWGTEEEKWDFVGAALALRAWTMFEAANEYGDIILREAFNQDLQQFTYQGQAECYDSVVSVCNQALSYLNRTDGNQNATNFTNSDFFFNKGDKGKWKKFVYGILARLYAYQHNKSSYQASQAYNYANLSCATNADNITAKFQNTGITGTMNYFGAGRGNVNNTNTGIRQSAFIADMMSGANPLVFTGVADPRRWYILRENPNGTFKGITPWLGTSGLVTADQPGSFAGTLYGSVGYLNPEGGRYIFRNDAEFPIMTAAEMQFIKAEAALRMSDPATARTDYINGISLSFDMLSNGYATNVPVANVITPASKAAYLADVNIVPATPAGMTLTRIMCQKYIAMYGWGIQDVWCDMRRYHYTNLDPATGQQVYPGFTPPSGSSLYSGNLGKLVYRCRPRYNSEYLYNIPALTAIGAYPTNNDYHTKETWFSQP